MQDKDSDTYIIRDLYAKPEKIYPRQVHGVFARLRILSTLGLLSLYYILPWINWNSRQAILLDLPARQFHFFGYTFWPQDFIYLTLLLVICALALFLFTTVAGRLWCGYACPQTVWTETFLWIEHWIEGDRHQRIKLDKKSLSINKVTKKTIKHTLWIIFSLFTGYTFVGYFTPIHELWNGIINFSLGSWEWFWIGLYSLATYLNAGKLREQVCLHMCPYARFQSAMFDQDTLVISYDNKRGEKRGKRKKGADYQDKGLGDCIDCYQCVQVCPTGIDIRDGLQYECIACAACIDVCDNVMDKMDYPRGLIKYTTENTEKGKPTKILRPKSLLYLTLFVGLVTIFIVSLATRVPLNVNIIRDRNNLYTENFNGTIENTYQVRILNMSQKDNLYHLKVSGIDELTMQGDSEVLISSGEAFILPVRLAALPENLTGTSNDVYFEVSVEGNSNESVTTKGKFLGPRQRK